MKKGNVLALLVAGALAIHLTACGIPNIPGSHDSQTAVSENATDPRSHTFDFSGNKVEVTVHLSEGWRADFTDTSVNLYDPASEGDDPAALGRCKTRETYETHLAKADTYESFAALENGISFTDGLGIQNYLLDLGNDVFFMIMVRSAFDGPSVLERFDVQLLERAPAAQDSIYLTLVNRTHKLPENWESQIELVDTQNYFGEPISVEKAAYEAYQALQQELLAEGVEIELESSYRSVERQQELWAEYEAAYGPDYCKQYVAVPGFSEHHTGFAIDTNLIQNDEGLTDEEKEAERNALWARVHAKMPEYGFILRYLEGKEAITGYSYEPWHMRYVGDPQLAKQIMEQGITLEEYLGQVEPADATVDLGLSDSYTEEDIRNAINVLRTEFATWGEFEMHSIRYGGDACNTPERVAWLDDISGDRNYVECLELLTDFHSPAGNPGSFDPDTEYTDYQWWLARTFGGAWELVCWGYWD